MRLNKHVKKALPTGEKVRRLPLGIARGLRISIDFHHGQIGTYLGLYEVELNRHLRRLCPPGARSFDLGGHIGYDALILAKISGSEVVTVESSPDWCEAIDRNLLANPQLRDRIRVVHSCVGDGQEVPDPAGPTTIDELAAQYFDPDFVKIDIEGGEGAALRGASGTLRRLKPNLLIEVHSVPLEDECLEMLRAYDYEPLVVDQRRFLPDHRPTAHNRWIVAAGRPSDRGSDTYLGA